MNDGHGSHRSRARPLSRPPWPVLILVTLSGVCGLGYEVVWLRLMAGAVGVGLVANAIVLGTFMLGLGVGAHWAGRLAPRERGASLRLYAMLEGGVGAWAVLVIPMVRALDAVLVSGSAPTALAMVGALVILGPPTLLMGATLPVLLDGLGGEQRSASGLGWLYGFNTIGATAGIVLTGTKLIPEWGLWKTNLAMAGLSLSVAAGVWSFGREWVGEGEGESKPDADEASESTPALARRAAQLTLLCCGFAGLGLEVVWMRGLASYARNTVATQVLTLAGVLVGLALGGLLGGRLVSRLRTLGGRLVISALLCSGVALAAGWSPTLMRLLLGGPHSLHMDSPSGLAIAALAVLPASLCSGAALVVAASLELGGARRAAGNALAINTAGSVLGAVGVGLVLVPRIGTLGTNAVLVGAPALAACVCAGAAFWLGDRERMRLVPLGAALLVGAAIVGQTRLGPAPHMPSRGDVEVVEVHEDGVGLAEIEARGDVVRLVTDRNHAWGSSAPPMLQTMRRQGTLPLLLHPQPRRVVEVGLATGVTFSPYLRHPAFEHGTVAEISPAVVEASRAFDDVAGLRADDRVEIVVGDGRDVVRRLPSASTDVIVLGLLTGFRPGVSNLYSRDFYEDCATRLGDGGMVVQWLALDQLSEPAFDAIVRAYLAAFDDVHAFEKEHYLALVGTAAPLTVEWSAIEAGRNASSTDVFALLGSHLANAETLRALVGEGPVNSDDRPVVEFEPPPPQRPGSYAQATAHLERLLAAAAQPDRSWLTGLTAVEQDRLDKATRARRAVLRGAIAQVRGDMATSRREFRKAADLNPADPVVQAAGFVDRR